MALEWLQSRSSRPLAQQMSWKASLLTPLCHYCVLFWHLCYFQTVIFASLLSPLAVKLDFRLLHPPPPPLLHPPLQPESASSSHSVTPSSTTVLILGDVTVHMNDSSKTLILSSRPSLCQHCLYYSLLWHNPQYNFLQLFTAFSSLLLS